MKIILEGDKASKVNGQKVNKSEMICKTETLKKNECQKEKST